MPSISGKRVAILATHGFEQSELEVPLKKLREAGATVDVVSLKSGEITGWDKKDWGRAVPVDKTLDDASPADYDALVLPGGQMNPDLLRVEKKAVDFVAASGTTARSSARSAMRPGCWSRLDVLEGRRVTSYKSIKTDVINAGGEWEDRRS